MSADDAHAINPESLLAAIVASSDDAIYSNDLEFKLVTWNPGAERLYGYTAVEAIGQSVSILIPPDRVAEERAVLARVMTGERVPPYESQRVRKDGSVVDVSMSVSPIEAGGRIVGASRIVRDISERKRVEAMQARFIANAAHELRTPLTTLTALSTALVQRWDTLDDDKRGELFAALTRQGERARLLISNLLELSQVEAGRLRMDIGPVAVAPAVRAALESAPPPGDRSVDVSACDGLVAVADPLRLQQVVANLLTNAYRYGGPRIRVEASAIEDRVVVTVSDDGDGVPETLATTLFDPFTRGPMTGVTQGSGLGLAICRALVQAFGGDISYEPNEPRGARFNVSLERAP